ncbi:adenylate cyclase [Mesorhizobium waimense]|uniref:Adenylate cyclase n=1 Tax=Mesorhizobium waimense TaxID=1300307 RepID=A0A3A5K7S4_9HYPH|nr:LuxR C-terminal-related transcriptional regulator [Mesorhizobium waimense]RJT28305.1 adenylate cyclase [Mesorhizobium waimense]
MLQHVDPTKLLPALSEREWVVAAKFAEGMSYREIGRTLFISPATVRTHLSTIYRKLGVSSKTALAALIADHRNKSEQSLAHARSGPSVMAVLPFDNLGSDERWNRLADGLSADIIADLARYPDLAVISRQTMLSYRGRGDDIRSIGRELNADYVLEGTLQAAGGQIRVSVQLADAGSGADLWSARYDQSGDDLFAMQDLVTENVVNVLASCGGKLVKFRRDVVRRKPPANLQAYDCYLLGVEQHNLYTRLSNAEAIRLLSKAVELDPGLSRAWTLLGLAYSVGAFNGFIGDRAAAMQRFAQCMERALELDPGDTDARLCMASLWALQGNFDAALDEQDRILSAAPHCADNLAMLAGNLAFVAGDPQKGCELASRAIRYNSQVSWYHGMLGRCCFVSGQYKECLTAFHQAPAHSPATLLFQAMANALIGDEAGASKIAGRLRTEFPEFTPEGFIVGYPVTNPVAITAIREGAKRASLA